VLTKTESRFITTQKITRPISSMPTEQEKTRKDFIMMDKSSKGMNLCSWDT